MKSVTIGTATLYEGPCEEMLAIPELASSVDLVLTDPPYNVDYVGKTKKAMKIDNDKMTPEKFQEKLKGWFEGMHAIAKPGAPIYVFHPDTGTVLFRQAMTNSGFYLSECLVWAKDVLVMGRSDYHWQHEPILYGWKLGKEHYWCGDRNISTTSLLRFARPSASRLHPTSKPVPMLEFLIGNSSPSDGLVCDPFMGSGSTCAAAIHLGRRFVGSEMDPKYFNVSCQAAEDALARRNAMGDRAAEGIPRVPRNKKKALFEVKAPVGELKR